MSENGEVEVDTPAVQILPKDAAAEIGTVKLFNKWSYEDVEVRDISLTCAHTTPVKMKHVESLTTDCTAITSRSAPPSTSLTPPAASLSSASEKHNVRSSSA